MTFEQFVNSIINAFNTVFPHITSYINSIISNNFIKFIIYLSLSFFVINILFEILKIIYGILNRKHDREMRESKRGQKGQVIE